MPKFKTRFKFRRELFLDVSFSSEGKRQRKRQPAVQSRSGRTTPFGSWPESVQMTVLFGFFASGAMLAPILVPTQAEIDMLVQLLH